MPVAILPLHHGSVLYPASQSERQNSPDVVLKHSGDGEVVRIQRTAGAFRAGRRDEYDAEYNQTGEEYVHFPTAVANIADQEAFGYRQDGEASTMLDVAEAPETVEVEPLDRGGVLVQNRNHLPFGIYLTTGEAFRVHITDDTDKGRGPSADTIGRDPESAVVEYRQDNVGEWEEVGYAIPTELPNLLRTTIGGKSPVEVLAEPSRERMADVIESKFKSDDVYQLPQTKAEDAITTRVGVTDRTAFPPNHPVPSPLFEH